MNSLTWLIYAIAVLGNVSSFASAILFITGFIGIGLTVAVAVSGFETAIPTVIHERAKSFWKLNAAIFAVAASLFVLTPSDKYLHLMAASEIGEKFLKTELVGEMTDTAKKSVQIINNYLDTQLKTVDNGKVAQ